MRFIHTSDLRIGLPVDHYGRAADTIRRARLLALENICRLASQQNASFVVIAGDLFASPSPAQFTLDSTVSLLSQFPCPVFVLPGDRDPAQSPSLWDNPSWRAARNVTPLLAAAPVPVPGGTLFPCPQAASEPAPCPTSWIPAREARDGFRIVVAHGNAGPFAADGSAPALPTSLAEHAAADYVALGHWPSTARFGARGLARMAYSGSPETAGFDETESGHTLLVTLDSAAAPVIEAFPTGVLRWCQIGADETVTSTARLAEIASSLERLPEPQKTLVEVVVSGPLLEGESREMARIERLCERFLYSRVQRTGPRSSLAESSTPRFAPARERDPFGSSNACSPADSRRFSRGLLSLQVLAHRAG